MVCFFLPSKEMSRWTSAEIVGYSFGKFLVPGWPKKGRQIQMGCGTLCQGVVLTHQNLVATMKSLMFMVTPKEGDIYLAYLPLAHVLELLSENCMMLFGIKVGYSNPNTMTDMSTKVRKGSSGDASVLNPSMMCAVPLILDK